MGWEHLVEADDREDIADESFAFEYVTWPWSEEDKRRHPGPPKPDSAGLWIVVRNMPPGEEVMWWSDDLFDYWVKNARAFRSLVHRLKNPRLYRSPEIPAAEADRRFRWHLDRCRPAPLVEPAGAALSRETYHGLGLNPTKPTRREWGDLDGHATPWPSKGWGRARNFWVWAFAALVVDDLAPHCQLCGALLANTPTGRRSRRSHCATCTFKLWDAKLTPDQRRKRWRRHKRDQRGG